uniref:Uncharacterized protein n=1 Tax=Grammatophora oceanica TaxID=210454 RepID=A0A7S1VVL0_9STRA
MWKPVLLLFALFLSNAFAMMRYNFDVTVRRTNIPENFMSEITNCKRGEIEELKGILVDRIDHHARIYWNDNTLHTYPDFVDIIENNEPVNGANRKLTTTELAGPDEGLRHRRLQFEWFYYQGSGKWDCTACSSEDDDDDTTGGRRLLDMILGSSRTLSKKEEFSSILSAKLTEDLQSALETRLSQRGPKSCLAKDEDEIVNLAVDFALGERTRVS